MRLLFPWEEFQGKRVVIHRDGLFRGEEKEILKNWAQEIRAVFYFVEVIKQDNPRLYGYDPNKSFFRPPEGTVFKLNEYEALLISSQSPNGTPRPLRIRTEPPFNIMDALNSVFVLRLLHYGSLNKLPRVPVTIHYADKIARWALQGIKPRQPEGNIPFWL